MRNVRALVATKRVIYDAFGHFNYDDGWAMASHLALSSLLAGVFPFLIFRHLARHFFGAQAFADTIVHLLFDNLAGRHRRADSRRRGDQPY